MLDIVIKDKMVEILSEYRLLGALIYLNRIKSKTVYRESVRKEVIKILRDRGLTEKRAVIFIDEIGQIISWAKYSLIDALNFTEENNNISSDLFQKIYRRRMEEQFYFMDWRKQEFCFNITENTQVIDVGAGSGYFGPMLMGMNPFFEAYHSIDLYPLSENMKIEIENMGKVYYDNCSVQEFFKDFDENTNNVPTVVFMAEFLHCFNTDQRWDILENCRKKFKKLISIVIVEPKVGSSLDILFGYHMMLHTGGARITEKMMNAYGRKLYMNLDCKNVSDFHSMYILSI